MNIDESMRNKHEPFPTDDGIVARERLAILLRSHAQIASAAKRVANDFPSQARKQLLSIGRWFEHGATSDQVLECGKALVVCLPLIKSVGSADVSPSVCEIENTIREEYSSIASHLQPRQPLATIVAYPLTLTLFCVMVMIGLAVLVVPTFEEMFIEFELDLPPITSLVIYLSKWVRVWGVVASVVCVVIAVMFFLIRFFQIDRTAMQPDTLFSSPRRASAAWAWHVALLLEAGLSQASAIGIAGKASAKSRLRHQAACWAEEMRQEKNPIGALSYLSGRPAQLLEHALCLDNVSDQSAMLKEVAAIYWERDRLRSRWYLAWLSPIASTCVTFAIGTVVLSLFQPLVQLISGLS